MEEFGKIAREACGGTTPLAQGSNRESKAA
jgi:hypothetical protein